MPLQTLQAKLMMFRETLSVLENDISCVAHDLARGNFFVAAAPAVLKLVQTVSRAARL
jgi:hypothetical protein